MRCLIRMAQLNKLKVFRDDSGSVCAYCAVHRADVKIGDEAVSVFKAEIAVSRDQRGRALSKNFIAIEFLRHLFLHPFRKTYFLSAYVHPASYRMAAGTFWKLYPSWRRPTPPEIEHLMNQLADALEYARNDERPWTRKVGWIPREDDKHRAHWQAHPNADIRYFLERNPNYPRGDGLLSITPITPTNILGSSAIRNCERLTRALRIRRGTYEIEPRAPSSSH